MNRRTPSRCSQTAQPATLWRLALMSCTGTSSASFGGQASADMTHTDDWRPVWERKGAQVQDGALDLSELLRANGYDTGHGDLRVDAWTSYTEKVLELFGAE